MASPTFVNGEYVDLFWRKSKVAKGTKVYQSRNVIHRKKVRSNFFVVKFENVLNGEVPLACPKE